MEKYILVYDESNRCFISGDPAEIEDQIRDLMGDGYSSDDIDVYKGKELKLEVSIRKYEVAIGGEV